LEVDMKIGVSGASGHLGRAVVSELLQRPGGRNLSGPEKGYTALGIYELDGDTLRICHTWKGQRKRPEKFAIAEGSGLVLAVWKREKK
jgi:hypothetical protein